MYNVLTHFLIPNSSSFANGCTYVEEFPVIVALTYNVELHLLNLGGSRHGQTYVNGTFNFRCDSIYAMNFYGYEAKLPNLKLKTHNFEVLSH